MSKEGEFDLEERLIDFAVRIIKLTEALPNTRSGNHIRGQVLRSGTSPAPNYAEAQRAESRSDFVHKDSSGNKSPNYPLRFRSYLVVID